MKKLLQLPSASTALVVEPKIEISKLGNLDIKFEFDYEEPVQDLTLSFKKAKIFQKKSEIFCLPEDINDYYDYVCIIDNSEWLDKFLQDARKYQNIPNIYNHYKIYIDSFGSIDVISESVEFVGV